MTMTTNRSTGVSSRSNYMRQLGLLLVVVVAASSCSGVQGLSVASVNHQGELETEVVIGDAVVIEGKEEGQQQGALLLTQENVTAATTTTTTTTTEVMEHQEEEEDNDENYEPEEEEYEEELDEDTLMVRACRRNPTWRQLSGKETAEDVEEPEDFDGRVSYDVCREVTGAVYWMTPTVDDDWKSIQATENNDNNNINDDEGSNDYWKQWYKRQNKDAAMSQCLLDKSNVKIIPDHCDDSSYTVPRAVAMYSHSDEGDLITVENALTDCEAAWLQALVDCMQEHLPRSMPFYQERPFGEDTSAETYGLYQAGGGNHVHYLAGIMAHYLPGVVNSIYTAMTLAYEYAEWGEGSTFATGKRMFIGGSGFPTPTRLGLRTAEYLEYHTTGRLGQHADAESVFTISIAMTDPEDYQGGEFQLQSDAVRFKVPRLSAVVFFSEAIHGITPITAGERRVFVTELWDYDSVPMGSSRPSVEQFLQRYGQESEEPQE